LRSSSLQKVQRFFEFLRDKKLREINEKVTVGKWEILIEGKRRINAIWELQITKVSTMFRILKRSQGGGSPREMKQSRDKGFVKSFETDGRLQTRTVPATVLHLEFGFSKLYP
jgi:hypothetical protein